ncbi:MAG: hypothetical protein H8E87_06915, partial [FCB group bacterium]|nr:hypothetical protein [FCB group bacterium]
MRKYIITILTLLLPAAVFAAAPAINSAAFHESTNILEIFFDSPIYTDAAHFSIGGLTLDDDNGGDNPDVTLNGGDILNTSAQGNSISIKLVFTGNIGSYEIDPDEFFTWGKDYRRLQDIESFEDSVKLIVRENTYLGVNNGPNNAVNLADAVHVNIITDQNKTVLSSAEYNFATNKITLVFTGDVQWDSIDEDLMHIWFDAAGMEHRDPGNYILDAGEDRNDNGVLDFEPNIDLLSITLHDDSSSFTLSGGIIDNTADNDTIVISPLLDNYKIIETFDPNTLKITIPEYAVVDVNYNPVEGVSGFPMAIVPDNDPLTAVSAVYNMGTNALKVYFSGPMSTGYGILPKFSFVKDNSTVTLQGASSPPTISASGGNIKIKLLNQDQMYAEMLMQGEDSIKVTIDNYAVLDNLGNGNIDTEVMAALIPESGSNTPPEVDSVYYYARQNRLEVYFDVNLKKTAEYVNIQGFSLFNGVDTLTLTTDNFGGASSNKVLRINFNPTDELAVESSLNKESLYLLVEDFSVYQQTKRNGNWAVTLGDSVKVHYVADDTPPLPDYVKYNTSQQKLILHFTDAMMTDVEFDSILFAGYNITGTTVEYGDTSEYGWDGPAWLKLSLTPGDISDIEGAGTVMDLIVITFTAGAFTNADGLSNEEWIDFKDGDVRTSGTGATIDSVKILAGIGRDFWLKSKEAFPTLDRKIPATIRKVGEHCIIYVADDQWVPYTEVDMGGESLYNTNNSKVPITQTEVDITYQHFESVDLAYSIINGIFAVGKENVIPDTVNIFLCDIRDEYSLGRNDTKDTYWVGSFFNPNDQKTEWQAADEFNTNDLDLIYIDSWPQLFFDTDSSWYWYETSSVQEWRLNTTPAQGG